MGKMRGRHGDAMIGGHGGLLPRVEALEAGQQILSTTQSEIQAELAANYRVETVTGSSLTAVSVGEGVSVLQPLPALSVAPSTWRPEFWTLTNGVIVGTNDLAGVYEVACTLSFSDADAAPRTWQWSLVRGRSLATSPVIAQRVTQSSQLSIQGEPDGVTLHGMLLMPASGADFEVGLFVAHVGTGTHNVQVQQLQLTLEKVGTLEQIGD